MEFPHTTTERRALLKQIMLEKGYSPTALARAIKRHPNTILNYLAGRTNIHDTTLEKVVRLLKVAKPTA